MSCDWPIVKLSEIVNFKTGRLDSNQAEDGGAYPFFTCSPTTLAINTYAFDDEAVLLAGNNANGVFTVKYYLDFVRLVFINRDCRKSAKIGTF